MPCAHFTKGTLACRERRRILSLHVQGQKKCDRETEKLRETFSLAHLHSYPLEIKAIPVRCGIPYQSTFASPAGTFVLVPAALESA